MERRKMSDEVGRRLIGACRTSCEDGGRDLTQLKSSHEELKDELRIGTKPGWAVIKEETAKLHPMIATTPSPPARDDTRDTLSPTEDE
jgi:hypothetical protein